MSDPYIPSNLIPPGINDERSRALMSAFSEELEAIDNQALLIQDALTVDERLLPEMTVARAMSSFIMPNMRQELVRQLLDNAHEIHENSGYIHGTRFALDLLGVRIRWTQWHNETPPAYHDTHKVRVFLNSSLIEDVSPLDPENQQAIARLIEVTKRKSQDLDVFYGLDSRIKVYTGVAHVKGRTVRINALSVSDETFPIPTTIATQTRSLRTVRINELAA